LTEVAEYRFRLRAWLERATRDIDRTRIDRDGRRRLRQQMFDEGLAAPAWPREYGGSGLGPEYQRVFNEETAPYAVLFPNLVVTVGICAALVLEFGTEEQRHTHLKSMLRGDETWTQLLSEPGAGSDLSAVSTRADRRGDTWLLSGQKVWTSEAHLADRALALVRTEPGSTGRHGLSILIVDMHAPGIEVRPLREMTGEAVFNEVFLDTVEVPASAVLGDVDAGWSLLLRMLHHERIALGAGTTGARTDSGAFDRLLTVARRTGVLDRPEVRGALLDTWVERQLMDRLGTRIRRAEAAHADVGPIGSIGKIGAARAARVAAEAGMTVEGMGATAWSDDTAEGGVSAHDLLFYPMLGIAGGTTEIQKNTIGERLLGLPREPRRQE
jgi:alkylation response protein AidB-like acyl-CoA dehydrogenase